MFTLYSCSEYIANKSSSISHRVVIQISSARFVDSLKLTTSHSLTLYLNSSLVRQVFGIKLYFKTSYFALLLQKHSTTVNPHLETSLYRVLYHLFYYINRPYVVTTNHSSTSSLCTQFTS